MRAAFRRALVRPPTTEELEILTSTLEAMEKSYRADASAARKLLEVGDSPSPDVGDETAARTAALVAVCNALFNLDETLTKE